MADNNLESILLHSDIEKAWLGYIHEELPRVLRKYPAIKPKNLPTEDFRELENGKGEIFVKIGKDEIKLTVPKGKWMWNLKFTSL
jgi:hypothetical protein